MSGSALDVTPPVGDRLVIRPAPWVVLLLIFTIGTAGIATGVLALVLLFHGQWAGLLFVAIAVFCVATLYVLLGGYLWADQERVVNTRLGERGSCRRDELASLRIVPTALRSGPWCVFVRKNGTEAFHTGARVWGDGQLKTLAQFLGVPLVHEKHPHLATNICPVCGYPGSRNRLTPAAAGRARFVPAAASISSASAIQRGRRNGGSNGSPAA